MPDLATPIQYLKGIGPRIADLLAAKGIHTVEDLLYYLPFRYEDRLNPRGIAELREGEMASVVAEVRTSGLFRTRRMPIFQMTAAQGRASLTCIWFNGAYLKGRFKPGQAVALYGKVERSTFGRGGLQIIQPQYEILGDPEEDVESEVASSLEVGRIVPIYETAADRKLTSKWFRRTIRGALEQVVPDGTPKTATTVPESLPPAVIARKALLPRAEALWRVHWPEPETDFSLLQSARTPAHRRLIFEELFFLELGLERKRKDMRAQPGIAFQINDQVRAALKKVLPFHPTGAQKRVLKEIAENMQQTVPMRRLLQGDVGCGKTIIALEAAIIAIENGYQVALMAPTEILATQHYLSARRILEPAGYRIVLLTGSLEEDRKRDTRRHIARGDVQLVIGTHALIEEKVEFSKLGLVIVDEQHRFGVLQRFKLMKKTPGNAADRDAEPDTLVMTATPIPRTLALTLYGDLDVSILDELPPGRARIVTRCIADERASEVWAFLRKQVAAGHQAYVVYPVIDESETLDVKPATGMFNELSKKVFPDLRVGLLHGRLDADEKDTVMRRFQRGELDVLVSTTVIEVGVDVPNANLMVVEHAERFGLAQLHQLRGRIGRGAAKSFCVLMTGGKVSEEAQQRLDAMARTTNGFEIAELDLQIRGPGEFFGTRQAGMPSFRVANLLRDRDILEEAKREAAMVAAAPNAEISADELSRALHYLQSHWQRRYGLIEAG